MKLPRKVRIPLLALLGFTLLCVGACATARRLSRMLPPEVTVKRGTVESSEHVRSLSRSRLTSVGKLSVIELRGAPEQIGYDHAVLMQQEMIHVERVLYEDFQQRVPTSALRTLLMDLGGFQYRHLPLGYSDERKRELAGQSLGFDADPFTHIFPTYQRLVYLNAVYDIALSFEHSPLVGCTTFFFDARASGGSVVLARNFDFDVHTVFDQRKVVFFVHEDGKIPFVSVSWPGLVGVVTGVNQLGVALMAHGARAGPTRTRGEPVVHSLRRVLSQAKSAQEAVRLLAQGQALVSHLVIVADRDGHAYSVERLVDTEQYVRPLEGSACVTNHLEGPAKSDPKNQRVRAATSTLARRERGDALLRDSPKTAADAVALLRDRKAADGTALLLGDRRAIDGLLAAHGVVMDFGDNTLWVSEGPHLLGRFIGFQLSDNFANLRPEPSPRSIPADPLLSDPAYKAFTEAGAAPSP